MCVSKRRGPRGLLSLAMVLASAAACGHEDPPRFDAREPGAFGVRDVANGREWQACDHGQRAELGGCVGVAEELTWINAERVCAAMKGSGWRLPSPEALAKLRHRAAGGDFEAPVGRHWSREAETVGLQIPDACCATAVEIETGERWELELDANLPFRCVRDAPPR